MVYKSENYVNMIFNSDSDLNIAQLSMDEIGFADDSVRLFPVRARFYAYIFKAERKEEDNNDS